jgi:UrcA family protein
MKTFKLIAVATALGITSLAYAVPAAAEAREQVLSETVIYSDLDLTTANGAAALYSRLKLAARRVCRNSETRDQVSACMRTAIDVAVKDVNRPSVTALHEGRAASDLTAQR